MKSDMKRISKKTLNFNRSLFLKQSLLKKITEKYSNVDNISAQLKNAPKPPILISGTCIPLKYDFFTNGNVNFVGVEDSNVELFGCEIKEINTASKRDLLKKYDGVLFFIMSTLSSPING
ncbi:hypothetical protein FACS189434_07270 [Bacteroidia bacterium]|nr:hypothetical protein FACS189434_07270 [Bacteroidia bacterium]